MGRTNVAKLNGKINITLMSVINGDVYTVSYTINYALSQQFVHTLFTSCNTECNTLCNTCPVTCSCEETHSGIFISYTDDNHFTSKRYPPEFDLFPHCYCECQTPTLMRILDITSDYPSGTFTESWRHASACDNSVNNYVFGKL